MFAVICATIYVAFLPSLQIALPADSAVNDRKLHISLLTARNGKTEGGNWRRFGSSNGALLTHGHFIDRDRGWPLRLGGVTNSCFTTFILILEGSARMVSFLYRAVQSYGMKGFSKCSNILSRQGRKSVHLHQPSSIRQ